MKNYKKFLILFILSISACFELFSVTNLNINAASFPHSITSHKWQMRSDGIQGGYSLKTNFNKKNIKTNNKNDSNYNDRDITFIWKFNSLKRANHNTYYGKALNIQYVKGIKPYKDKDNYKIKLINNNTIWIIRKHIPHTNGNYQGNNNFGAVIFNKL